MPRAPQDPWNLARACERYRAAHPERIQARSALNYAVKRGRKPRPDFCDRCDSFCRPEGAHLDYSRPLDVLWLCKQCHEHFDHGGEAARARVLQECHPLAVAVRRWMAMDTAKRRERTRKRAERLARQRAREAAERAAASQASICAPAGGDARQLR